MSEPDKPIEIPPTPEPEDTAAENASGDDGDEYVAATNGSRPTRRHQRLCATSSGECTRHGFWNTPHM